MTPDTFNIMQWNAQSAVAKRNNLDYILIKYNIHVAIIAETWYKKISVVNFKHYNVIRNDREDGYGGVAILVSKDIPYKSISFLDNFNKELLVCGIFIPSLNMSIASVYRSPNCIVSVSDYDSIFKQITGPYIVGVDFNAHHTAFGSSKSDNAGNVLIKAIDNINAIFLIEDSDTRLTRSNSGISVLDLTFVLTI